MSEHLLFLQAAGSDFGTAHELVNVVSDVIRASHNEQVAGENHPLKEPQLSINHGSGPRRPRLHPERIAERLECAGYTAPESLLIALAVHATIASPLSEVDVDWIASVAARVEDEGLLLETAGVVFTFNTVNRIADARRVRLEYSFLRELKPIQGWVERRLVSLTGLAYDMSYKYQARRSPEEMLDRLGVLFERLGAPAVPDVFHWLSRSPVVLEGVLEMIEANLTSARIRSDLLKEAAGIAVASRAMSDSGLSGAVDQWLFQGSLPDSKTLRAKAAQSGVALGLGLASASRRYAWQVANAAYTVTDEQIGKISALGVSDAELFDLTLASALFSALAIVEPLSAVVAPRAVVAVDVGVDAGPEIYPGLPMSEHVLDRTGDAGGSLASNVVI